MCQRQRMEQQMKSYIKALKKSINQERFLIRVAGLEYEVAQKLSQPAAKQENCGPGREKDSGRCGKWVQKPYGFMRTSENLKEKFWHLLKKEYFVVWLCKHLIHLHVDEFSF